MPWHTQGRWEMGPVYRNENQSKRRIWRMRFFIELLLWHVIIAGFLIGALMLSRGARQSQSPLNFLNDPSGD
jgi:hypothetical protein